MKRQLFSCLSLALLPLFFGCSAATIDSRAPSVDLPGNIADPQSVPAELAGEGIALLSADRFEQASKSFNRALQLKPDSAALHFLNGLAYHLRALRGDGSLYDQAEQGYRLAIRFQPDHWLAHYNLGLLHLDRRQPDRAQEFLAEALLLQRNDPDLLYSMVVASYRAEDPRTAAATLEQLQRLEPDSERVLQAATVVMAALDRPEEARGYLKRYRDLGGEVRRSAQLARRLEDWDAFFDHLETREAARESSEPPPLPAEAPTSPSSGREAEAGFWGGTIEGGKQVSEPEVGFLQNEDEQMVIVDIVIIRTEEDLGTRKGVNLLNGLEIQFGNGSSPALENERKKVDGELETDETITRFNIPALTYSLNIFNARSSRNEILARPTLLALNGRESEFFSGIEIKASTVGSGDYSSESVEKSIGVKLKVVPEILAYPRVRLAIQAERTFLQTPSNDIIYENKVEVSKTTVITEAVMNLGDTLILSGLSEKETERLRDGVPLLQDIPLLQYFFSQKDTRDFQRSVLILLTPRLPEYVYSESGGAGRGGGRREEGSLSELRARYSDWFKPYPTWASVFHHMQSNSLYREFRTGDVTLERWDSQEKLGDRLRRALEFLYF